MLKLIKPRGRYRFIYLYIIVLVSIFIGALYLYKISYIPDYYDTTLKSIIDESTEISRKAYIEAKKKEPVYINLPSAQPVRALVENYNLPASLWALINKSRAIPPAYVPAGLTVPPLPSAASLPVRADVVEPLTEMFAAAKVAGYNLKIASAYRSYSSQENIFNASAASVGKTEANKLIALPGQSEHQTGLALDLASSNGNCYIQECFANTPDGRWLAENSYKYGFILRYPQGKESITGYNFEPWHFRYVGRPLAEAIYISGLTYEQAWPYLTEALNTLVSNGAIII